MHSDVDINFLQGVLAVFAKVSVPDIVIHAMDFLSLCAFHSPGGQ